MPSSLCHSCQHCRQIMSGKGSQFYLCELALEMAGVTPGQRFPKYPPQPVLACAGYRPQPPGDSANSLRNGDSSKSGE